VPDAGRTATFRPRPAVVAAVAAGGALGAPARYAVARLVPVTAHRFPWATFWTNVSGALVLGVVVTLLVERFPPTRYVRPFVATGFLGAYTTFSTFAVETDTLVKDGDVGMAVAYATTTLVAGLAAAGAGVALARAVAGGAADRRRT
jgi:CrcB protein